MKFLNPKRMGSRTNLPNNIKICYNNSVGTFIGEREYTMESYNGGI